MCILYFTVIHFFFALQFSMSLASLVVLIVHLIVKPYKKEHNNIIEAAVLLNLLLVTGAFLNPSADQVPYGFAVFLVVLPFVYALGYIVWRVGKKLWYVKLT